MEEEEVGRLDGATQKQNPSTETLEMTGLRARNVHMVYGRQAVPCPVLATVAFGLRSCPVRFDYFSRRETLRAACSLPCRVYPQRAGSLRCVFMSGRPDGRYVTRSFR